MPVITIREQQRTDTGFEAILSFDGRVNYPISITDPFTTQEEQQLEWYFEEWLVYPMLNTVKAQKAADSVKAYGQKLFEQVFKANFDAYSDYRQLRGNLNQVQIEIESQIPEFQALHWEALRDLELPRPFGVDCVMLRKRLNSVAVPAYVQPSPVINLLVVTARPNEDSDVGYRTISRPLIEAIQNSQLRVNVELTTHFAKDVFYFGYDEKAWTLEQILFEIGKQVYQRFEQANFQVMKQAAQVQKLVAKLRSESYILILDNLESVTGQQLAIQNTLTEAERNQIRDFLGRLVGGETQVVLGSRSGEEWLQAQTFKTNVYQLQGLDPESRSVLAEKILERHVAANRIPTLREDAEFGRLMKLLAGYPLAMEVVLANLRQQSPKEILEKLQAADVNLDNKRDGDIPLLSLSENFCHC